MDSIEKAITEKGKTFDKFVAEHEADRRTFSVTFTRHGQFMEIVIVRRGEETVVGTYLPKMSPIRLRNGYEPDMKGMALVNDDGEVYYENTGDYGSLEYKTLKNMPRPAEDDQVTMGKHIVIDCPAGVGRKVFDDLMASLT